MGKNGKTRKPHRPIRPPAAHRRRHQVPHQGRHRPAHRGPLRPLPCAPAPGRRGLPRLRCAPDRPQHGGGRPQRRGALLLRRRLRGRTRSLHGRVVQPQQILPPRSHARYRPDDQLRSPLVLASVVVIMQAGSLSTVTIVENRPATPASSRTGTSSPPGASSASSSS